jgi:hypothetical protein
MGCDLQMGFGDCIIIPRDRSSDPRGEGISLAISFFGQAGARAPADPEKQTKSLGKTSRCGITDREEIFPC